MNQSKNGLTVGIIGNTQTAIADLRLFLPENTSEILLVRGLMDEHSVIRCAAKQSGLPCRTFKLRKPKLEVNDLSLQKSMLHLLDELDRYFALVDYVVLLYGEVNYVTDAIYVHMRARMGDKWMYYEL